MVDYHLKADDNGFFGDFGGAYIPEMLNSNISRLANSYYDIITEKEFQNRFKYYLRHYCGRPTALTFAENASRELGGRIFLKREDLNHTGAHKITNAIGQALLAEAMGKTRIIAETGAGQHGVATATACALIGIKCVVYMGDLDVERQSLNVQRMKMLGAEVVPVHSGSKTLKDATNEAIRDWINNPVDTHYIIGSAVGPHPYPEMVSAFQSIISEELKEQILVQAGKLPDRIVACIGGGSNAVGAFYHFIADEDTRLIGVEAAGKGVDSGATAASITIGTRGILHGSMTMLLQTADGQIQEAHSVSAGLDYPGVGPVHAHLAQTGRIEISHATDQEAIEAALWLTRTEGIIPALETAHAIAAMRNETYNEDEVVVLCLSGRGDKDMPTYIKYMNSTHHEN